MPYLIRLLILSLASFFLLHAAFGAILALLTPAALRVARRLDPRRAAGFLFFARMFPSAFALLLVAAFCVPSYFRLEPAGEPEGVGVVCFAAAALGAALIAISLVRSLRAIADSARFLRDCRRSVSMTRLPGQAPTYSLARTAQTAVWVVEKPVPLVVALAGVFHPRLIVSKEVLTVLSPAQLELALLHERAHSVSHDNLKRLLEILAPDLLPRVNPWRAIERERAKFTEWAADDDAAGGNPDRSISLAATLVTVARAGFWPNSSPLLTSFIDRAGAELEARVDRLLEPATSRATSGRWLFRLTNMAGIAFACGIVLLALQPSVLSFVHEILERLIA
jgi:hypothetical protein